MAAVCLLCMHMCSCKVSVFVCLPVMGRFIVLGTFPMEIQMISLNGESLSVFFGMLVLCYSHGNVWQGLQTRFA